MDNKSQFHHQINKSLSTKDCIKVFKKHKVADKIYRDYTTLEIQKIKYQMDRILAGING